MARFSRICSGIMLALFLLIVDAGLLLGTLGNLAHPSYTAALLAGLVFAAALFLLLRRAPSLFERWGTTRTALLLTVLCFGVNLLWVLVRPVPVFGDAEAFWYTARALARREPLENAVYLALFPHLLGYSSFLSLFVRLFGDGPLVAPVVNVCLSTVSGLLLYRLCLRYLTPRQAGWAYLLWALCPSKLLYNGMVLSDGLYTCLLLAVFLCLSRMEDRRSLLQMILPGLLCGLLLWGVNISRPLGAIILIALPLWFLFLRGATRDTGRWAVVLALMLAVYLPLGLLWNAHIEDLVGEEPAPVPGYNIYVGFNQRTGGIYAEEDMELLGDYRWEEGGTAVSAQKKMLEAAKARIFSGKLDFPRLFADKLRNLIGNDEGGVYSAFSLGSRGYRLGAAFCNACYYMLVLLSNLGAWLLWKRGERRCVLLLPLFGLGLILAQMLVEVSIRYHYSLIPVLIVLAACSLPELKRR